jgi:hypothetical protein
MYSLELQGKPAEYFRGIFSWQQIPVNQVIEKKAVLMRYRIYNLLQVPLGSFTFFLHKAKLKTSVVLFVYFYAKSCRKITVNKLFVRKALNEIIQMKLLRRAHFAESDASLSHLNEIRLNFKIGYGNKRQALDVKVVSFHGY